ncbi:MAG TPA: IS5 family transposase [Nitrospirota bacterium]|nr:IS5 family transposase [Nitrospirota bacterium]
MHISAIDLIATLVNQVDPQKSGPGHPWAETVRVVRTLRYFAQEGVGWRALTASDRFVSGSTLRRWLGRWFANGTLRQIHRDLVRALRSGPAAAAEAIAIVVDSCSVRAKHGGDLVGPNPTDRGKPGTKYHVITLTDGTPLGAIASKANTNDTILLPHLLKLAQAVCASIAKLFADAGYDSSFNRAFCRKHGVEPLIRRRQDGHGSGLGKVRHIVENALSWLLSNKRLDRRHDRSTIVVQSLLNFACVYVVAHRLTE